MRFVSTIALAVVALTSSTVSAFVSPSSSIIKASTSTHLKMSQVEQPDVSAYMSGARAVSAKFSFRILLCFAKMYTSQVHYVWNNDGRVADIYASISAYSQEVK